VDKRESKRLDRFGQFGLAASVNAVNDAGLDFTKEDAYRCGVLIGSGIGGIETLEEENKVLIERGVSRVSPFTVPRLMVNAASGNVSIRYGIHGPNTAVATACATGSNAIGDAARYIEHDQADVMIAGGSEAALCSLGMGSFCAARALSTRNEDPQRASRPWDKDRDGFVMGEGAGVVILEEYEHAKKRGARIYAELVGYGMSGDAYHITQPEENGKGASVAMNSAIREAKIAPDALDYINAHGTSTPLGDLAETKAIKTTFGAHAKKVAISSTKSHLGHLLGASGGVEAVITCKAVMQNLIPPTINLDNPDPECDLDYTPHKARDKKITYAMSNSFGFGGHNASLLFKKLL
jgi:3-oxoacyl-[acyl-carrier-protein] synthase II